MKTAIFCTSYINDHNSARYENWVNYYSNKLDLFKANDLFLIDDGSPNVQFDSRINVIKINQLPKTLTSDINLFHFEDNLGRPSLINYPGWWRSFTFSVKLAQQYNVDKLIHIESDFYVVSTRMAQYVADLSNGWTAFYSKYHSFPETAIQIICKDSFKKLNETFEKAEKQDFIFKKRAEHILPFTKIEKNFYGDRFGEWNVIKSWIKKFKTPLAIDYLGQMSEKHTFSDYEKYFSFENK